MMGEAVEQGAGETFRAERVGWPAPLKPIQFKSYNKALLGSLMEGWMPKRVYSAEQIIGMLRETEVLNARDRASSRSAVGWESPPPPIIVGARSTGG